MLGGGAGLSSCFPLTSAVSLAPQLALRGPPGPMGYTGRPGPLVSELGVKVAFLYLRV